MGTSSLSSLNTFCSFVKVPSKTISEVQRCLIQFSPPPLYIILCPLWNSIRNMRAIIERLSAFHLL